jgi:hypothetical protein
LGKRHEYTPSLLASIASMRLFLLTFHILLRGRDLAYNTFVPFNFIPTLFRTRRAKLREVIIYQVEGLEYFRGYHAF